MGGLGGGVWGWGLGVGFGGGEGGGGWGWGRPAGAWNPTKLPLEESAPGSMLVDGRVGESQKPIDGLPLR